MRDYIPPELLKKAKEMDLLTYLMNFNPSELVKITEDTYSTKTHDSLIISNNLWHRFSTNEGGKTPWGHRLLGHRDHRTRQVSPLYGRGTAHVQFISAHL